MPNSGTSSPTAGIAPSSATADAIRLERVSFGYGSQPAICDLSLSVPRGAFATLLGPSGCGKSTLLKLIGGYLAPQSGTIHIDGRDVTALPPEERSTGMVFQHYALFPHLTARRNISFGLEVRGVPKDEVQQRAGALCRRVGLSPPEADRYPSQLSGGQQQRVALARALCFDPPVLLLDEPLSSLDRQLREQLALELVQVHRQSNVTTLMVTHDQEEALSISQYVGVMRAGRIVQFGPPQELYFRPLTPFVASFLGEVNFISGEFLGRSAGELCLVRPERIRLGGSLPGRVMEVRFLGSELAVDVECEGIGLKLRAPAGADLNVGDPVSLAIPPDAIWPIPERDELP